MIYRTAQYEYSIVILPFAADTAGLKNKYRKDVPVTISWSQYPVHPSTALDKTNNY